jgi:hypothetical protein
MNKCCKSSFLFSFASFFAFFLSFYLFTFKVYALFSEHEFYGISFGGGLEKMSGFARLGLSANFSLRQAKVDKSI